MTNGGRKKTQAPHKPSVYEELVPSVHLIGTLNMKSYKIA